MKQKISAVLLSFVLALTFFPCSVNVSASTPVSGECGDALDWSYDSDTKALTITGSGDMYDFTTKYLESPAPWLELREEITSVSLPEGLTSIGACAFYECKEITEINVPENVTAIGEDAFWYCTKLHTVSLPDVKIEFGDGVFFCCAALKNITIPALTEEIPEHFMYGCDALESITVPNLVETIGGNAFAHCDGLSSVLLPASLKHIGESAFFECISLQAPVLPSSLETIGREAFYGCSAMQSVVIPDSVTTVGNYAFYNCSDLISVSIGKNVRAFPNNIIMSSWKIKEINVSAENNNLASKDGALYNKDLSHLEYYPIAKTGSYIMPETVSTVADNAMYNCSFSSVEMSPQVTALNEKMFFSCSNLESITLSDDTTIIGNQAFTGCASLTEITLPDKLLSIGDEAFCDCPLESIAIPASVTTIGTRVWEDCENLMSITVDEDSENFYSDGGVLYDKAKACLIKYPSSKEGYLASKYTYEILDTTVVIRTGAFQRCSSPGTLKIPLSVVRFEDDAFEYIGDIDKIYYEGTREQWNAIIREGDDGLEYFENIYFSTDNYVSGKTGSSNWNLNLYDGAFEVLYDDMDDYTKDSPSPWSEYKNSIKKLTVSTYEVGAYSFYQHDNVTAVEFPARLSNKITQIGEGAFEGCSKISSLSFVSDIDEIADNAFKNCTSLKNIRFDGNITKIGDNAFAGCTALETVYIDMEEKDWNAQSHTIGEGNEAFLEALTFYVKTAPTSGQCGEELYWSFNRDSGAFEITGSGAMYDYVSPSDVPWSEWRKEILSVTLPNGLREIGRNAFYACENLKACTIPAGVEKINGNAFAYCYALEKITIPAGIKEIPSSCFNGCKALCEVSLPDSIETIGSDAFAYTAISGVSIPNAIEIGPAAFSYCDNIIEFNVPEKVVSMGINMFEKCQNIKTVTIPASVMTIGASCFNGCRKLENIFVDHKNPNYCSQDGVLFDKQRTVLHCFPGGKDEDYAIPNTVKLLKTNSFDGYFRDRISIPLSLEEMEYNTFPFGDISDIYYGGTQSQWEEITIPSSNSPLDGATIHPLCDIWPKTQTYETILESGDVKIEVAADATLSGKRVLLACYKNETLVAMKSAVYSGENLEFTVGGDYDSVKVMSWGSVSGMDPVGLCEKISEN